MILPIVKNEILLGGTCRVPERITVSYAEGCAEARLGAQALISFCADAEPADSAFVRFEPDLALEQRDEIYRVSVREGGITVSFRDARGAVNGAATVSLLLKEAELAVSDITDYPSLSYRSCLIDMARGLPTFEDMEYAVRYMALAKLNRLHLHLMDSCGICYMSDAVPELTYAEGACDKEYIRRLIALCASFAIEIVPEIEIPAHADHLCAAHPELKCDVPVNRGWTVCPGSEGLLPLFDKLIGEVAELFADSEYIHVGSDEIEFRDIPGERYCYWDECPKCAALREREGLADRQEEFYYLMRGVHELVKSHGKKTMMWGDQIDVSRDEVALDRDILVEFWRVAGEGRGPRENCSLERLLEHGFRVVNAYYPYTYFDEEGYMTAERMRDWTPLACPIHSEKYDGQIIGAEACAWEYGNYDRYSFYDCVAPTAIALFGDKVWGLGQREHNAEFKSAVSTFVFGNGSFSEVFDHLGDMIAPKTVEKLTYREPSELSEEKLIACAERLRAECTSSAAQKYAARLERIAGELGSKA